jgi:hypothetical protein
MNPETDHAVRRHNGIDSSSQDASGQPAPLGFSTPVGGTVTHDPDDTRNPVTVTTDDGDSLLFRHASAVYVTTGQRVSPSATIGKTGHTGPAPGPTPRHVAATDPDGTPIDPNTVQKPHDNDRPRSTLHPPRHDVADTDGPG